MKSDGVRRRPAKEGRPGVQPGPLPVGGSSRQRRGAWPALTLFLFLGLAGCGLFSIRDPMAPVSEGDIPQHLPLDPDSVLFNFASGLSFKQAGVTVMTRALADTFKFKLDPTDARVGYGVDLVELTKQEVQNGWLAYLRTVGSADVRMVFRTEDAGTPQQSDGEFLYDELPYSLLRLAAAGGIRDTLAAGQIDLYFRRKDGNWFISRWEDKIASSLQTFGAAIEKGSTHPR